MATKKSSSTEMVPWDAELAAEAQENAATEASATGGGQFISVRGGQLSIAGQSQPGNKMAAVVLDSIMVNAYYPDAFDADNPTPPSCYAFGRKEDEMGPHDKALDKQAAQCRGCPNNEYGSAVKFNSKGQKVEARGKACKNGRRLAVIAAGTINGQGAFEAFSKPADFGGEVLFLNVPPTSLRCWGGFVSKLASTVARPPWAVYTEIAVVPDAKSQFKITFNPLQKVPDSLLPVLRERHKEAMGLIEFPFPDKIEAPAPAKKGKSGKF